MKKYILLDFDGVMIPSKPWKPVPLMSDGFYEFSRMSIDNLNRIVKETGAEIILITSHKTSYPNSEWKKMFEMRGILGSVSRLEDNMVHSKRLNEVLNWCEGGENRFVILDDDKSLNDLPNIIKNHLILCDSGIGLNSEKTDLAIKILNNDF
jgi:hypothetical protein